LVKAIRLWIVDPTANTTRTVMLGSDCCPKYRAQLSSPPTSRPHRLVSIRARNHNVGPHAYVGQVSYVWDEVLPGSVGHRAALQAAQDAKLWLRTAGGV
jgi:hypothetical protein